MRRDRPSSRSIRVMGRLARRVVRDRRGATAVEYGLIVALIVIAMMASFFEVASVTKGMWNNVSTKVTTAR